MRRALAGAALVLSVLGLTFGIMSLASMGASCSGVGLAAAAMHSARVLLP